jgi:DNA repair photolyase
MPASTTGTSPSQTAISESSLEEKGLCDYVVTVADGCSHGCEFCYVQSMPQIWGDPGDKFADAGVDDPSGEWGDYALYRDDVVANTADDCQRMLPDGWTTTERGQGVVGISFHTDCYMDPRAGELTKGVVRTLVGHGRDVRILTRNAKLLAELHRDFYGAIPSDQLTIGASIPSLREHEVAAIEADAPAVKHRLQGLAQLRGRSGPSTTRFVSMSPTYPTHDAEDLRELLEEIVLVTDPEVVFHEPINPRSGNISACIASARQAGEGDLARALEQITDDEQWVQYALGQLVAVQEAAEQLGQPVHLWPDKWLVDEAPTEAQREWCRAWRQRPTPEQIGDGPRCTESYPEAPEVAQHEQASLEGY